MPLSHFPGSTYPLNCKEQSASTKDGIDRINDTHQPDLPIMPLQIKVPKEIRLDMIFWHHLCEIHSCLLIRKLIFINLSERFKCIYNKLRGICSGVGKTRCRCIGVIGSVFLKIAAMDENRNTRCQRVLAS